MHMVEDNDAGQSFDVQEVTEQIHLEEMEDDFTPTSAYEASSSRAARADARRFGQTSGR